MVEQGKKSKQRKYSDNGPQQGTNKKFQSKCYICDKPGHRAKDCRKRKDQNKKSAQANVTEVDGLLQDISEMNLSAVVSEVNMVENPKE